MTYAWIGWGLNAVGFLAHIKWCDKDPTHEDVVVSSMMVFSVCPFLVFGLTTAELITQKIFNIHHGVKRKKYKDFDDLEFLPHKVGDGIQALMDFPNGYGVSVVRFKIGGTYGSYTLDESEFEFAVMKNGKVCYSTPITNDVIGHLTQKGVGKFMRKVQKL